MLDAAAIRSRLAKLESYLSLLAEVGDLDARTVLVHDYLDVDFARLHRFIRDDRGDFALFAKAILELLGRKPAPP